MLTRSIDYTYQINNQHQITMDVGEYDRITAQFIAPIVGTFGIYGTIDGGAVQGKTQGNAALATNFSAIQAKNLATGSMVSGISAAGLYEVDTNTKYVRFSGGTSVYNLYVNNMKIC